jgi:hypothetical protein
MVFAYVEADFHAVPPALLALGDHFESAIAQN